MSTNIESWDPWKVIYFLEQETRAEFKWNKLLCVLAQAYDLKPINWK